MKTTPIRRMGAVLAAAFLTLTAIAAVPEKQAMTARSIEGTYKLVSRQMPDGVILTSPDVMGLMTFTKDRRNFNVFWKNPAGKIYSYSVSSTYKLSRTEYAETILFSVLNDQIGGKDVAYELSTPSKITPVTTSDNALTFKLPFDPVTVTFEGDRMIAKSSDFTDTWEKVK